MAVSKDQSRLHHQNLLEHAEKRGVLPRFYATWDEFAADSVYHGPNGHAAIISRIPERVLVRAKEIGVSKAGQERLRDELLFLDAQK